MNTPLTIYQAGEVISNKVSVGGNDYFYCYQFYLLGLSFSSIRLSCGDVENFISCNDTIFYRSSQCNYMHIYAHSIQNSHQQEYMQFSMKRPSL